MRDLLAEPRNDRITDLHGAIINDGITADEARALHARLVHEGTAHRWERWTGERTLWSSVARFDELDDVHTPAVTR